MSYAKGDDSGKTIYLHNNNGKDDNGDDSAGETSYLTNNGKGPNSDDRRPAAGGGAAGSNTGGSSITTSGGGSSGPDLGEPATAAAEPVPAWIAVLENSLGQLISTKLDQALEGRIPAAQPQPSQQAATSEQPPSLKPASTSAQEILQLNHTNTSHHSTVREVWQQLPEDHNIRHSNSNSRSNKHISPSTATATAP